MTPQARSLLICAIMIVRVRDGDRIVARPMTIDHADKLHGGSATKRTSSRR
jgi:hypothetical protein